MKKRQPAELFEFSAPALQIRFAYSLRHFRAVYLRPALLDTLERVDVATREAQLKALVATKDLASLVRAEVQPELVFALPAVLRANPYLLGYYRLLLGYSQKEFYGREHGFGVGRFKAMETDGRISALAEEGLESLCAAFSVSGSALLKGLGPMQLSEGLFDDLTLLTVGPQLRGGANNQRGAEGIVRLFELVRSVVSHAIVEVKDNSIEVLSATKRRFVIEFAADPDIEIREEMAPHHFRNVVAIEVKSGTDISNIHNRIGEAEKSHQKARQRGFTECWTVVNVSLGDYAKAKEESPSTDRFYSLSNLDSRQGEEFEDFRRRIVSLTAIPTQ